MLGINICDILEFLSLLWEWSWKLFSVYWFNLKNIYWMNVQK